MTWSSIFCHVFTNVSHWYLFCKLYITFLRLRGHGTSSSAIASHCNSSMCRSLDDLSVLRCTNSNYSAVMVYSKLYWNYKLAYRCPSSIIYWIVDISISHRSRAPTKAHPEKCAHDAPILRRGLPEIASWPLLQFLGQTSFNKGRQLRTNEANRLALTVVTRTCLLHWLLSVPL